MSTLREELAEAEARAAHLRNRIAAETCATAGHDWRHIGGRNAGCERGCCCSIPVHECTVCGDSDYGDNEEARTKIKACAEEERLRADEDWFFDMDGKP
jgi:hypothetical protein